MSEITKFILTSDKKELFFVSHYVPVSVGDIVEYDEFGRDGGPSKDHVYSQYKVVGKVFRMNAGFIPEMIVELKSE